MALLAVLVVAISGCGAVSQALQEGADAPSASASTTYEKDMYLLYPEPVKLGIAPDPSGSLSLSSGDMTWAQSIQADVAEAIANYLPALPSDEADLADGAPGAASLVVFYMPIADTSGNWRGGGSSIVETVPAVPALSPEPRADQEDDVPGRYGKGEAWAAAKNAYVDALNAATAKAAAVSKQIAEFPLSSEASDVYGSVTRLADRMGEGTILVFSDFMDTGKAAPTDLSKVTVIGVQACTAKSSDCDAAKNAFAQFVVDGGGMSPTITGHEAAKSVIADVFVNGG